MNRFEPYVSCKDAEVESVASTEFWKEKHLNNGLEKKIFGYHGRKEAVTTLELEPTSGNWEKYLGQSQKEVDRDLED